MKEMEPPRWRAGQRIGIVAFAARLAPSGGTFHVEFSVAGAIESPKDFDALYCALLDFCERFSQEDPSQSR